MSPLKLAILLLFVEGRGEGELMLRRTAYGQCEKGTAVDHALSLRQKLAMVVETSLTAEMVVDMDDEAFNYNFLREHNVSACSLRAAKITVTHLKRRGVDTAHKLALLGFSSLHLTDAAFCADCVSVFGADSVLTEFFASPSDAIVLAGSCAMGQLGLDVGMLLLLCESRPIAAREVLVQCHPRGECLRGVPSVTLLETGISATHLIKLGFDSAGIREQTLASPDQLRLFGF